MSLIFSDIEYSRRINPLKREYIEILADATETAEALYESLQKRRQRKWR